MDSNFNPYDDIIIQEKIKTIFFAFHRKDFFKDYCDIKRKDV